MENSNLPTFYTDGEVDTNTSDNAHIMDLVEQRYSRRETLTGMGAAAAAFMGASLLSGCEDDVEVQIPAGVVDAGADITISAGRVVTLNGTGTNSGVNGLIGWEQVSGPTVTLTNAGTPTATFVAPGVSASTALVFRFRGSDQSGAFITDDVTVTVTPAVLGFNAVAKSLADVVVVPTGYSVTVLYRLGDPLLTGVAAYGNTGTDTNFAGRAGDHHDGMTYFGLAATGTAPLGSNSERGLLVMNHENINQQYLHTNGPTSTGGVRPTAEVQKEMECHGVSVVEITRASGTWAYVQGGALNRRFTPFSPTTFNGPVRGTGHLFTAFSTNGTSGRGTINNCANGITAWSTYITCEENWAGYFRRDAGDNARRTAAVGAKSVVAFTRYGLNTSTGDTLRAGSYSWTTAAAISGTGNETLISKFNATVDAAQPANGTGDFRNEPNQYGWVVEIDPYDATSTPRKRTALGRMNHEGCWPGKFVSGRRPAFYMGDDATNEYLYKFVSTAVWDPADASSASRLAIGDKYLDTGTLYVAKFNSDGTGQWLAMVFGQNGISAASANYAFVDQADVLTNVRLAADIAGATKMDRPEWTAINPNTGEMYLTLTNNSTRTPAGGANPTDTANPRAYSDPRTTGGQTNGNANGHIIRLRETSDNTESLTFTWDIYVFGAGSDLDAVNINLSGLDATNDFSSPDGLWFGRPSNATGTNSAPVLWIETDDGAFVDQTNCMLLAAQPGVVGDGTTKTITNTIGAVTGTQTTRFGAAPGAKLRRFLVGPKECEITGIDSTPDGRTIFVNIQHPGENATNPNSPTSSWPQTQATGTGTGRPRSATIAITKNDGGVVGV